jgi:hypothetical protein
MFSRVRLMVSIAVVSAGALMLGPTIARGAVGDNTAGCPVDDPGMLASPPGAYTACVDYLGGGPWTLGNMRLRAAIHPIFGVYGPDGDDVTVVPGPDDHTWSASIDVGVPPALPGSVCSLLIAPGAPPPRDPTAPYNLCLALTSRATVDTLITARFQPAGPPSGFRLSGVTGTGPVLTLPVKLHLESSALGSTCYIGSDAQPIVLHLNAVAPASYHQHDSEDPDGYPVAFDDYSSFGSDIVDTSFAVPAASGCGSPVMDAILNLVFGLPSPSGNSVSMYRSFVLDSTTAGGAVLSEAYHSYFDR